MDDVFLLSRLQFSLIQGGYGHSVHFLVHPAGPRKSARRNTTGKEHQTRGEVHERNEYGRTDGVGGNQTREPTEAAPGAEQRLL
jgi:hypothetical protein